jgi:acyl-coenzyme A thioesterase PaaI-like protein
MNKGGLLIKLINFWPPFLFAGIRRTRLDPDFRAIDVELVLRWFNRNYVGTHFGGSLFAMTDPWFMLMLMQNLGRDYYVWDKRSTIDFIAPGRGVVRAEFRIDEALLAAIREHTAAGEKYLPEFTVDILDAEQKLVARVHKTIYIRKKPPQRQTT